MVGFGRCGSTVRVVHPRVQLHLRQFYPAAGVGHECFTDQVLRCKDGNMMMMRRMMMIMMMLMIIMMMMMIIG